jgi:cytochrome c553
MNCSACHEEPAANVSHLIPILDGMDAAVIFKQLADYRSGKRSWGVMNGIAKALTVQDSADVAAYFATLPEGRLHADSGMRIPQGGRSFWQGSTGARLVFAGDQQRGIAPCAACHGPGGYKLGAPPLAGQYTAYIERQLAAFAQDIRQNDIYEQMRAIARLLKAAFIPKPPVCAHARSAIRYSPRAIFGYDHDLLHGFGTAISAGGPVPYVHDAGGWFCRRRTVI